MSEEKLGGEKRLPKDKNDLAIEYINQMLSDQYNLIEDRKLDKDYESDKELKEFSLTGKKKSFNHLSDVSNLNQLWSSSCNPPLL